MNVAIKKLKTVSEDSSRKRNLFRSPPTVFGGHHMLLMYKVINVTHLIMPAIEERLG